MQLGGVDAELGDHLEHQLGEQAGAVGVEEPVQRAADPVVVEDLGLARSQPEQTRGERGRPLCHGIERLASQEQVGHHEPDRRGRRQPQPGVISGQIALEQSRQPGPVEEVVHHRQRTQPLGVQVERSGARRVHRHSLNASRIVPNSIYYCLA